jgi:hypothetical protein
MDKYEWFMSRARAERGLRLNGGGSLWGFENWDKEGKDEHHIGKKKYSDHTIMIPVSMHRELTRRQMEEHPTEGPDPSNPLERQGRVFLGLRIFSNVSPMRFAGSVKVSLRLPSVGSVIQRSRPKFQNISSLCLFSLANS